MIFECLDGSFCGIDSVVMWFDELVSDVFFLEVIFIVVDATLSIILYLGRKPRCSKYLIFFVKASMMDFSDIFGTGVARMALEDQPYRIKIARRRCFVFGSFR